MRQRGLLLAVLLVLALAGCGGKRLVKVSGRVTLEGNPVSKALVTFHPVGGEGTPAAGVCNDEGVFYLTTRQDNDGAYTGTYKVTVEEDNPNVPTDLDKSILEGPYERPGKKRLIHVNYANPKTTPFEKVVPTSGPVELTLNRGGS
jgi:hypothetical protein